MIHIWHEDNNNSSTQQFWNFLKQSNVHNVLKNADVRGFNGNEELYNFVESTNFNLEDTYHIFIDKVEDNEWAMMYCRGIEKCTKRYKNIKVHNLLCFEYLILKFKYFIQWTTPMKYNKQYEWLKEIRKHVINCVDNKIHLTNDKEIVEFMIEQFRIDANNPKYMDELKFISSEKVVTKLLSRMTNGGTIDFGVSKTRLGSCWTCDCCSKYIKPSFGTKKCKIYKYKKTSLEKAMNLWNNTLAKEMLTR